MFYKRLADQTSEKKTLFISRLWHGLHALSPSPFRDWQCCASEAAIQHPAEPNASPEHFEWDKHGYIVATQQHRLLLKFQITQSTSSQRVT